MDLSLCSDNEAGFQKLEFRQWGLNMKKGRPTKFDGEIAKMICLRLLEGESLRSILEDPEYPSRATVYNWLNLHDDFLDQYEKAKNIGLYNLADEILEIADNASNDWMETNDSDNEGYRLRGENIQRSRLRIDSRKWILSKLLPKKFGDRLISDEEERLQSKLK